MCPSAGSQKQATVYSSINSLLILLCLCSNWPTFPQIFIKGEFVGGSDIILDMHQASELIVPGFHNHVYPSTFLILNSVIDSLFV